MAVEPDSVDQSEPGTAAASTATDSRSVLSQDDVFDLLSNQRRRCVLHALEQRSGERTDLRELSRQIAAWENGKPTSEVTSTERRRVYTSLQQFHLPKLHENGVVVYDDREGSVTLMTSANDFDIYLDVVAGKELPWSLYYTGLSALGLVAVLAAWLGVYPLSAVSELAWGAAIAATFAVSAVVHACQDRRARLGTAGPPSDLREY